MISLVEAFVGLFTREPAPDFWKVAPIRISKHAQAQSFNEIQGMMVDEMMQKWCCGILVLKREPYLKTWIVASARETRTPTSCHALFCENSD